MTVYLGLPFYIYPYAWPVIWLPDEFDASSLECPLNLNQG
jgi:hypothetical protein